MSASELERENDPPVVITAENMRATWAAQEKHAVALKIESLCNDHPEIKAIVDELNELRAKATKAKAK